MPGAKELLQRFRSNAIALTLAGAGGAVLVGLGLGAALRKTPVGLFEAGGLDTGSAGLNMATDLYFWIQGGLPHINTPSIWDSLVNTYGALTSSQKISAAQVISPFSKAGFIGMGTISAVAAGLIIRGGPMRKLASAAVAGLVGGVFGAYKGAQLGLGVSKIASQIHKEIRNLNPSAVDRRAFGGGAGYRTWAKLPGRSMPVGHLGATGDLVLAMHRTRHRSMF